MSKYKKETGEEMILVDEYCLDCHFIKWSSRRLAQIFEVKRSKTCQIIIGNRKLSN